MTEEEEKEFMKLLNMIHPHITLQTPKIIRFPDDDRIVDHIIRIEGLYAGGMKITHILSSPPAFGRGFSESCTYRPFHNHESKIIYLDPLFKDSMPQYVMFGKYAEFNMRKLFDHLNLLIVELI